ncbi:MAG: PQQ-binding-like beta-propeller repeat protein, partial [Acidobacteriota bacterium]
MRKICFIAFIIFLQFSCSLFRSHSRISPYPSGIMFPLEPDARISYEGKITDMLQKRGNKLFLSTTKGKVYCIDGNQRQILWEYTSSEPLAGFPYLGANHVLVFDEKNTLYCIDQTGQLKWKKLIPDKITSQIGGSEEQIYIGTEKGTLFCLKAENGEIIWSFKADGSIRSNPVVWNDQVIFGGDDQYIYILNPEGNLIWKHHTEGKIGAALRVDENFLYFGTSDHHIHCLNLKRRKSKWDVYLVGNIHTPPAIKGKNIFFLCSNGVLYCLNKRNGTTLWWNLVSSLSYFKMEIIEEKVAVSSLSSQLVSFDIKTGKIEGVFDASQEIRSNPLWFDPYLLVNLYDGNWDIGKLAFLKKKISAALSPSKKSPQTVREEITFTAEQTGFYMPEYEFSLIRLELVHLFFNNYFLVKEGDKEIVQEASKTNTWKWMPREYGIYIIEVKATDEKETALAQHEYMINKEKPKVFLSSSVSSPQELGQTIDFSARASGLQDPEFEFQLIRLENIHLRDLYLNLIWGEEQIVQESSEENTWSWTPEKKGFYLIKVTAS